MDTSMNRAAFRDKLDRVHDQASVQCARDFAPARAALDVRSFRSEPRMGVVPLTRDAANEAVLRWHRHHGRVVGHRFAIGAAIAGELVGVAIVGRPVARRLDDGATVEITRLATSGWRNACSFLYGASRRIAFAMGFRKVITYTLLEEPGTSLVASGFVRVRETKGETWDRPSRARSDRHPTTPKILWLSEAR